MSQVAGVPATQNHGHSCLPPTLLLNDVHAQLLLAFQLFPSWCTTEFTCGDESKEPSLILYCPIEGGESVIDATVHELAARTKAIVKTIDLVQCMNEPPENFWRDVLASKNEENEADSGSVSSNTGGYFDMHEPINTANLVKLAEAAIAKPSAMLESTGGVTPNRRIVYFRDFGFLATFAPASYTKILSAIHEQQYLGGDESEVTKIPTAFILGASPLPRKEVFSRKRLSALERDFKAFLRSLNSEPESSSATQRLRRQRELWKSGALTDHIYKCLDRTGVLAEGVCTYSSNPKRLPTCLVVPAQRKPQQERLAREKRAFELNLCQVQMALLATGGELCGNARIPDPEDTVNNFTSRLTTVLFSYEEIKRVANRVMGNALMPSSSCGLAPIAISWEDYCAAWGTQEEMIRESVDWWENLVPDDNERSKAKNKDSTNGRDVGSGDGDSKRQNNTEDAIFEWLSKQELTKYQEKVLNCLIRSADMLTGFDSVHLPDATIDAMRTLVSLRVVCPRAFHSGILKQYNMSGALLFGPPGTGKTHLVKAIAKESGARMISIKPSDILEKWVGQMEKTIDALFGLARLLKPCIIFIDEIDALFGARLSAKDSYQRWRTDILTQFAQEMDGMLSSDVIVIGATNRPFDIDDAIIRRLPCRILIDLPDKDAREAILRILLRDEQLEAGVDLAELAALTPSYSGSDLKNVCVMAAFESAKELANISWNGKKSNSLPAIRIPGLGLSEGLDKPSLESSSGNAGSDPGSQPRTLAKRHFTYALTQIQASTSESQSSLLELRRWNIQFGTATQSKSVEDHTEEGVIEWVKRQGLSTYQQKMLNCLIRPSDMPTGFDSVHLPDETIDTIRTLVSLRLVCPEAFHTGILEQYSMSGALLFGPPGTGKTHLVKAIAKESGARMISIKPSDITDKLVGEEEKTIDALFKLARLLKPCIIFIDEIDALFGARVAAKDNQSRWRTDMLTQFAQEMDGMLSSDVIVIGATNRPFDLDDAIIRRLPCRVLIDLPDRDAREAILRILLRDEQLETDVDLTDLAGLTPNFSGSDLKHVCVTAAFESAKELANISWSGKKQKKPLTLSPMGIPSPAASHSGKSTPPTPGLTHGLPSFSVLPNDLFVSIELPDGDSIQPNDGPRTRRLAKRHFTQALKQIRASTSESQSSLVELRRWNDQFGSGNQSSKPGLGGPTMPGLNIPGSNSNRPWMNGSGVGSSGVGAPGAYTSGLSTPGRNVTGTSIPGVPSTGTSALGANPAGLSFTPPVEGSYLRSLGIQI